MNCFYCNDPIELDKLDTLWGPAHSWCYEKWIAPAIETEEAKGHGDRLEAAEQHDRAEVAEKELAALRLRVETLRHALEEIENLGAEHPDEDMTARMFSIANLTLAVDDKSDYDQSCDLCRVRFVMRLIMSAVEDLPEFDASLFDDVITDVYNAADAAHGCFRHPGCDDDS